MAISGIQLAHAGEAFERPADLGVRGLERLVAARTILDAMRQSGRASAEVADEAARLTLVGRRALIRELAAVAADPTDTLLAAGAVHALGAIAGHAADRAIAEIMQSGGPLTAHTAWACARRPFSPVLVAPLVGVVAGGGLAGMHAQQVLAAWARRVPLPVAAAIRDGLHRVDGSGRHLLVEALGHVPGDGVLRDLLRLVLDRNESDLVRVLAVAALADRGGGSLPATVGALGRGKGRVADAVRRATAGDGKSVAAIGQRASADRSRLTGTRVAQVHLGATLDASLQHAGVGNTGGIATLLVKLGAALNRAPGIADVLTIGRGPVLGTPEEEEPAPRHRFAYVAMQPEAGTAFTHDWPGLIEARRGVRRILRHQLPDVIHLRMADVGSLAGAQVAAELGITTVFTLAPDPHVLIEGAEESGRLDRRNFAAADAAQALWYRVDLVQRLARQAAHVVLFPRDNLAHQLRDLAGIDLAAHGSRFTVVPEGVDVAPIRAATSSPIRATRTAARDLLDRIRMLPRERHGLPLVLSVGRLVEIKGMARLVEAFGRDNELQRRANLVIVGGDLEHPTAEEQAELDRMQRLVDENPWLAECLVLLGHRPNGEVPDLLALARHGHGSLVGAGGVYAAASRKEEFGLAIVEALAAGLPVVAPVAGGPRTYVEHGRTGYLVDTTDALRLGEAIRGALGLAGVPGRAEYAAARIGERYDIRAMAGALVPIYAGAARPRALERAS